ncbi:preprotein translocase subunit YajC [Clostridium massiliamazoniense]|uniref:preprotein translocase subunit YajC n=1 Tax=Clostridium massiliamazoniense TaxID=1347366 RepID=UPI0006D77448|nr:preprotein translocase subunit YajC [Clostridium massiliamazoniense]
MNILELIYAFVPFIFIIAIFWFMLVRPEKKRQKVYSAMIQELKVNDKIITKGGIIGIIIKINGEELVIESERTKLKIMRKAVSSKLEKGEKLEDKLL